MGLTLIRHTRVAVAEGLCYGRTDVPLAWPPEPAFAAVAATVRQPVAAVVSSPAVRALALAQHLATRWQVPLTQDVRWQELDFGAWEGQRWAAIDRTASDFWCADVERRSPPGGESRAALRTRVQAALAALHARCRGAHLVVVCHAGPIRVALGAPLEARVPWGSAHRLRATAQGWAA
ncbi:MAG: histidine phosphatase family protein [Proteobacteria bacterium]|nr:histidine phosphatase family protein [Pseudomonadota bacterium]